MSELRMLTRVARMYHEEGLPQREIAARLSLSQSRVSRMLRRASETGIVRTVVTPPPEVHADLEDALREAFGLRDAIVVDDDSLPALGAATADYLDATVSPGERIGIASWSATLMAAADAMSAPVASRATEVTQLVGGVGDPAVQFRATGLTARLAALTGARAVPLPAPGLLRSATLRDALVLDPAVAGVMDGWDTLTLALVGIGGLEPSALLAQSGNAICASEAEDLRERGAVGDICFRFFDSAGFPIESPLDARVLGIAPDRLQAIPRRIGVAGGARKYPAVRAALRGGWINVLITDAASAQRLAEGETLTMLPSFRLDDQVALVTGAASGIGREIALGLAEAGAAVGCVDRNDPAETVAEIGERAVGVSADVTDPGSVSNAVAAVEDALGPIKLAVNAAGIANATAAEDMPLEQFQQVLKVNLDGVFLCCQAEGRSMLANGGGAIVNIASMSGSIVNRDLLQVHYNASKAAVIHLSKSLAMEWAPRGIRVNAISPGYTATPMNTRPEVAEQVKRFEADTPLGRMAAPTEMVGPAVFLLSEAASFVTGIDLIVDGGFVCW